jgi:hypothetical protein
MVYVKLDPAGLVEEYLETVRARSMSTTTAPPASATRPARSGLSSSDLLNARHGHSPLHTAHRRALRLRTGVSRLRPRSAKQARGLVDYLVTVGQAPVLIASTTSPASSSERRSALWILITSSWRSAIWPAGSPPSAPTLRLRLMADEASAEHWVFSARRRAVSSAAGVIFFANSSLAGGGSRTSGATS